MFKGIQISKNSNELSLNYLVKYHSKVFVLLFLFLFVCQNESNADNLETIINFGDNLFITGNYINALEEYQRAYFFSGSELKWQLGNKIADCYLVLGDFRMARNFYDSVAFYSKSDSLLIQCEFQKILCFMKENNFGYAMIRLNNLEVNDKIYLQRRKNLYQGICSFGTGQYDESEIHFLNYIPQADTARRSQLIHLFDNQKSLNRPNSGVAIMLSLIIPGSGQVYSGDVKDGLNSLFLLSGLVFLGSATSPGGILIAVPFFIKYYMGGIVHAKQIADGKKKEKKSRYYSNLVKILLN
jgi:tetratricopeptide (TPR) repeat protein